MTVFGLNCSAADRPAHTSMFGSDGLGYSRFFFGPAAHADWGLSPLDSRQPTDRPVISVKTWNPADFTELLDEATIDFHFTIAHEPERRITDGTLTPATLANCYREARKIRSSHRNGYLCRLLFIFTGYALTVGKFDWHRLQEGVAECDLIGVDTYALEADRLKNIYTPARTLFAPALAIAREVIKPWCVPEFACRLAPDGNSRRHALQIIDYARYAHINGAQWVSWFCNYDRQTGRNFHLEQPGQSEALNIWTALGAGTL